MLKYVSIIVASVHNHCVYFFTANLDLLFKVILILSGVVFITVAVFGLIFYVYFRICKKYQEKLGKTEASQSTAVNPADIPVQMTRGQNGEPEVHIGLDQEQQTYEIGDEEIPSGSTVYLIDE